MERLQPAKDLTLQIFADNKTKEEGAVLVIPQSWNAKKTVLQDIKDKSNQGIRGIGNKTGSDTLKDATAASKYWWALPVAIIVGMLIFGLIIYWAIRGITRKDE